MTDEEMGVINIERLFLVKAGFTRKDNSLPKRLTDEPMPEGPSKGHVCHLEEMLDDYCAERGAGPPKVFLLRSIWQSLAYLDDG